MHDLIGGRAGWTALGLPTHGALGDRRRVSQSLCTPATVVIDGTIGDARAAVAVRSAAHRWPIAVVNAERVLLGSLDPVALRLPDATPVEAAMASAPGTVRPELRIDEVVAQLRRDGLDHVYVTAVNGTLLGLAVLAELHV